MLAKLGDERDLEKSNFWYEPKLDGTRALFYYGKKGLKIVNRRGSTITYRYPEFEKALKIRVSQAVLDGEIVVLEGSRPSFEKLQQREHIEDSIRIKFISETIPATYYCFDILWTGQKELIHLPLEERRRYLKDSIEETDRIRLCIYTSQGRELFDKTRELDLEGVMGKERSGLYYPGERSDCWIKIKHFKSIDCVICGYTRGKGSRSRFFGALLLGAYREGKLVYLGKVGTGWTENGMELITDRLKSIERKHSPFEVEPSLPDEIIWVEPKLVCEVKHLEVTSDSKLRVPSFSKLRFDKAPKECEVEW